MLVGIDVKCMHTNFGGHSLSGFVDIAIFKNEKISLSGFRDKISLWSIEVEKFNRSELAQNVYALCKLGLMSCACTPVLVGVA